MNIFIIFVKFLGWIIAIGMRLVKLIVEKGGLTTKMKKKLLKKKKLDPGVTLSNVTLLNIF